MASPQQVYWNKSLVDSKDRCASLILAATETYWNLALAIAQASLGDAGMAADVMDSAVERTRAYITEREIADGSAIANILLQFYKREIRKLRLRRNKLVSFDQIERIESYTSAIVDPTESIHNKLDIARILKDTDPKTRQSIVLHYVHAKTWNEVAQQMNGTGASLRRACARELDLIRNIFRSRRSSRY